VIIPNLLAVLDHTPRVGPQFLELLFKTAAQVHPHLLGPLFRLETDIAAVPVKTVTLTSPGIKLRKAVRLGHMIHDPRYQFLKLFPAAIRAVQVSFFFLVEDELLKCVPAFPASVFVNRHFLVKSLLIVHANMARGS